MNAFLALRGVDVGFPGYRVLGGVDLELGPGDFVVLVGENGAGKTTLLRTVLGLQPPLAGRREVAPGMRMGYVPQELPIDAGQPLTVADVVRMGGWGRGLDRPLPLAEALERLALAHRARRRFGELSGGQKQRALIARALTGRPRLLALDEPTSGVDAATTAQVHALLADHARGGGAVLLVTHRPESLEGMSVRVLRVGDGSLTDLSASPVPTGAATAVGGGGAA